MSNLATGREFRRSAGRWATEQLLAAFNSGKPMSPDALRPMALEPGSSVRAADLRLNATLRKDEWVAFDEALVEEGKIRLRGVADLINAGLVKNIPNAMGKTMFEWEKVTDMEDAELSLSGVPRTENDRPDFEMDGIPLPVLHKDFNINLRTLEASRNRGESLDTTQGRMAGRKVSELLEQLLFQGTSKKFGGRSIYGYMTHPNRNTASFGTGGAWSGSKTGEQMLTDLQTMIAALHGDRMFGPYVLYVPGATSVALGSDFKAQSDKTIKSRLLEVDGLTDIRVADQLPAGNLILVQMTPDVVTLLNGEPLQTVQWDLHGGMEIAFKAFQIAIPLIRADADGRSGVFHMA
jgi:hypothetical protein